MLVPMANQKRATTSSSLKIEEVEERPVANQDGRQRGSNQGPVASKSGPCLLSWLCSCVNQTMPQTTLHHSGQVSTAAVVRETKSPPLGKAEAV